MLSPEVALKIICELIKAEALKFDSTALTIFDAETPYFYVKTTFSGPFLLKNSTF